MPTFLWTGKTAAGKEEVERVIADTPEAARAILEDQGWTDLRQQTMEIHEFASKQVQSASDPAYRPKLTPKQELAFLRGTAPGFWSNWLKSLRQSYVTLLLLGIGLALALYRHKISTVVVFGACMVVIVFLFPVIHWWFSQTANLFQKLHAARNWRRWDEVLGYLDKLQKANRSTKLGIGDAETARYRALALAGLGRLDEGIEFFTGAADKAKMPKWIFHCRLASIYSVAKQYDKGLEQYRLALEAATDKSIVWIDMGGYLVERFDRTEEAKQLLAQAEGAELPEMARPAIPKLRGKIAYREKDFAAVDRLMREALAGYSKNLPSKYYIFEPSILICKGYLAASNAALGNREIAQSYFAESGKYLSTICLDELVSQYHAFMAQPGTGSSGAH